ncbi:MAG: PH domain-containing protein [Clostridia bacterium]|nr:PH domain-containing protein [Clostridia bacterium]
MAKKNRSEEELSHIEDDTFAKGKKVKVDFDDEVIRAFDLVLDSDEKIEKAIKPEKAKVYLSNIFSLVMPFLIMALFIVLVFCLPSEEKASTGEIILATVLPSSLFVLSLVLVLIVSHLYYKNTFFASTNKRLIIRTGIFGVDYKSVDLENITANNIVESVLDKMLKKGTGTIKFMVLAEAVGIENRAFAFSHIKNPYDVCKEIKERIDIVKSKQ